MKGSKKLMPMLDLTAISKPQAHATDKSHARLAAVNPHHHSDFMDTLILKDYGKILPSICYDLMQDLLRLVTMVMRTMKAKIMTSLLQSGQPAGPTVFSFFGQSTSEKLSFCRIPMVISICYTSSEAPSSS